MANPFHPGQPIEVALLVAKKSHRQLKAVTHEYLDCTVRFERVRGAKGEKRHWRVTEVREKSNEKSNDDQK